MSALALFNDVIADLADLGDGELRIEHAMAAARVAYMRGYIDATQGKPNAIDEERSK